MTTMRKPSSNYSKVKTPKIFLAGLRPAPRWGYRPRPHFCTDSSFEVYIWKSTLNEFQNRRHPFCSKLGSVPILASGRGRGRNVLTSKYLATVEIFEVSISICWGKAAKYQYLHVNSNKYQYPLKSQIPWLGPQHTRAREFHL